MTIESRITRKATEVKEKRDAIKAGIRLDVIEYLVMTILELLTKQITERKVLVESINILLDETNNIEVQLSDGTGIFTAELLDDEDICEKLKNLNQIALNYMEYKYVRVYLARYCELKDIDSGIRIKFFE